MKELSIFEKIALGLIPSFQIWESNEYLGILSIDPKVLGHTLVIPKKNIGAELFSLDTNEFQNLMIETYKVANFIKEKLKIDRILMEVHGLEVPHIHIHLIPFGYKANLDIKKTDFESVRKLFA